MGLLQAMWLALYGTGLAASIPFSWLQVAELYKQQQQIQNQQPVEKAEEEDFY